MSKRNTTSSPPKANSARPHTSSSVSGPYKPVHPFSELPCTPANVHPIMGHAHTETHTLCSIPFFFSLPLALTLSSFESHNAKCKCKRQRGRTDQIKTARSVVRLHFNHYSLPASPASPASHVLCVVLSIAVLFFRTARCTCGFHSLSVEVCVNLRAKKLDCIHASRTFIMVAWGMFEAVHVPNGANQQMSNSSMYTFYNNLNSFICTCCLPFHYVITNVDGDFQFSFGNYLELI